VGDDLRCDPDGMRTFAIACGDHAAEVGTHRHPQHSQLPRQATSAAVADLHDAVQCVAENLADRIRSTASAVEVAAQMYSLADNLSGAEIEASMP